MIFILLFFSSIFTIKSILLSEYYNNFLLLTLYSIELSVLSFNTNIYDIFIRWIFIGFFRHKNEIDRVKIFNYKDLNFNENSIIISWVISYILFNIYVYIKNRKAINKFILIKYNLKYCLINYTGLSIWSLNILINYKDFSSGYFFVLLFSLYMYNFITFWFPGLIFNYIYGEKLYKYRVKYSFLIDYYLLEYKYITLILQIFKSMNFIYCLLYNYNLNSNYYLIVPNILLIIFYKKVTFFKRPKLNNYLIILHLFSLFIIFINIIEYLNYYIIFIKYVFLLIQLIFFIYSNINFKIKFIQNDIIINIIEMDTIV